LNKTLLSAFVLLAGMLFAYSVQAQSPVHSTVKRCATAEVYEQLFRTNPEFKKQFIANRARMNSLSNAVLRATRMQSLSDTIPVVIHVIAPAAEQLQITDAILQSQIDVVNKDYQGLNADSTRIPVAFKSLYGKSNLVFMLARQDELGEPTTGIVRKESETTYTAFTVDNAKQASTGGSDAWNPARYLNLWVVSFGSSGVLGVSVFPGDPRPLKLHGFVCDYRAFGKDAPYQYKDFRNGRTTTHELGHFFGLYHIWGDDDGACSGSDFEGTPSLDDTPNQSKATYGNPDPDGVGLVVTDACSPTAPGIMYQNYMDYSNDTVMVMFTKGQQQRMELAITTSEDRLPVLSSDTYKAPVVYNLDARVRRVVSPGSNSLLCTESFAPVVTIRNSGTTTITSLQIVTQLNNGTPVVYNWAGTLAPYTERQVTLANLIAIKGANTLTVSTQAPNGAPDQNPGNNSTTLNFTLTSVTPLEGRVVEGFNSPQFPPANWGINNPDGDLTWERHPTAGFTAPGSAWFANFDNATFDRFDDLIMPAYSYQNIDSVFLNFQVAAAIFSDPDSGVPMDTLSVLLSKDCGNTFTTVYKKSSAELETLGTTFETSFEPLSKDQWRRDSVNLTPYLDTAGQQFSVYFRFTGNYENNVYIDDVTLYTKVVPARLKEEGVLVLPTVTTGTFGVWHYQQPIGLRSVTVHNASGQLVWKGDYNHNAEKFITVDLSRLAAGVYFVNLGYDNKSRNVTQRIIKR
jgi:hypothetical protein